MSRTLSMNVPQHLRRHRRPLGWILASLVVISLAGALGQCLAMSSGSVAGSMASAHPTMPGDMPCADCTASDARTLAEVAPALPGSLKPGFALALVVVSTLLALGLPKSIPIPPRPLLPKRPRTLEFAVLRI